MYRRSPAQSLLFPLWLGLYMFTFLTNAAACHFEYFDQQIDHFGAYNGTFRQKYNLVSDFYRPGGPILLFHGEESTELDCVDSTALYHYAQQLGGVAVSLEHRYFGESKPFNASDPLRQPEAFEFLTLENVIADAATFLHSIKQNITGAANAKVIVGSGSYGAFLVTALRQNIPDSIWGAISSAPPLIGLATDTNMEDQYLWNLWLNKVYQEASWNASVRIRDMYTAIDEHLASGNLSDLQQRLNLCQPANTTNFKNIIPYTTLLYNEAAEFNYANIRPGRTAVAHSLDMILNVTLTNDDPIDRLGATLSSWYQPLGYQCIDVDDLSGLQRTVTLIESPVFNYLVCRFFPFTAGGNIPNGTIFPPATDNKDFVSSCQARYNITVPPADELRSRFKYTNADLQNSTRILWVTAQYDPTTGCAPNRPGFNAPLPNGDVNVSRQLYVSNMAHREELFAPAEGDRATVIQAREIELNVIRGWLSAQE